MMNFPFCNLSAIYNHSLTYWDSFNKKAFEYYFETQEQILELLRKMLICVDFNESVEFWELEKLILNYISRLVTSSVSDWIKWDYDTIFESGETMREYVLELLKKSEKPVMNKYNVINIYVELYEQINYNLKFIEDYNKILKQYK